MTPAPVAEPVFDGRDVQVRIIDHGTATLVVTFTPLHATRGFASAALTAEGVSHASVISLGPHWWQTAEMPDAIAALRASAPFRRAGRIVLFGSSMGGTGALLHSSALGADQIVVFCPQFSVDPAKVPFERRWAAERSGLRFVADDMSAGLSRTARILALVDPHEPEDRQHLALYQAIRTIDVVRADFAGHYLPRFLLDTGLLGPVIRQMADGRLDAGWLRNAVRAARRRSIVYALNLAEAAFSRRPDVARCAIEEAERLATAGAPPTGLPRGGAVATRLEELARRVLVAGS